jgi:DNA-directed RNA polymerase subunit RPC12/RpoP
MVDLAVQEPSLTLLCVGYLCFPCFDIANRQDAIQLYLSRGHYGLLDYAYAYWSRHLDKALSVQPTEDTINEMVESVSLFVDMYWNNLEVSVSVPRSLMNRLQPLQRAENFQNIASTVHQARQQLHVVTNISTDQQLLTLVRVLNQVRAAVEEEALSTSDPEMFKQMYGTDVFKCPRVNCIRFYEGFPSRQERDEHVPKHERSYFCSFSGCHMATLGCATLKELQKHDADYHGTMTLNDDDEDFPEMPPEKTSFDCETCKATFTRKHNLKNHIRIKHTSTNVESFLCSTCGKKFARLGDRTRHESTAHSDAKKFICGGALSNGTPWGCGRVFNRGDVLSRHWKSEKGKACILPKQEEEALQTSISTPVHQDLDTPSST